MARTYCSVCGRRTVDGVCMIHGEVKTVGSDAKIVKEFKKGFAKWTKERGENET